MKYERSLQNFEIWFAYVFLSSYSEVCLPMFQDVVEMFERCEEAVCAEWKRVIRSLREPDWRKVTRTPLRKMVVHGASNVEFWPGFREGTA